MSSPDQSRRRFLLGAVAAAAEVAILTGAAPAFARGNGRAPVTTIPPVAPRDTMTSLLPPLPRFIRSGPTTQPRVALTVDDLFGTTALDSLVTLLDVAKAKGVQFSFFPTGGALQGHLDAGRQDVWRRVVAEGHEIGNHTYTHANLTTLTDTQVRSELSRTRDTLAQVLGPSVPYTMRMMRPPGGAGGFIDGGDPRIMKILAEFGYAMAMWTIDSNNTAGNASLAAKVVNTASNGSIALFHFTTFSVNNFAPMIDQLRSVRKLTPTNISGLFGS